MEMKVGKALTMVTGQQARLVVYVQNYGKEEIATTYLVPGEAVDRCLAACKKNKLYKWEKMNGTAISGGSTVVKYKDGDKYVRAGTDNMPNDGEKKLGEIGVIMQEYIVEEYQINNE